MGRQARAIPQNWEARCPGSLRTNWVNPHPRAGVTQPTSAQIGYFDMGSWLDHPRSHCDLSCLENHFADWARRSSEPGSRKWIREFLKNSTFGFYFGSRKYRYHSRVFQTTTFITTTTVITTITILT